MGGTVNEGGNGVVFLAWMSCGQKLKGYGWDLSGFEELRIWDSIINVVYSHHGFFLAFS